MAGYFQKATVARGTLTVLERSIVYPFMFNPAEVTVTQAPQIGVQNVPGASHGIYQWGSGGEKTISFELPLDGELQYRPGKIKPQFLETPGSLSVLPHIQFLESIRYPSQYGGSFQQVAPYTLVLTLGSMLKGITVICKKSDPTILMFTPSLEPMKAKVSMTFGMKVNQSMSSQDVFKYVDVSEPANPPALATSSAVSTTSAAQISLTRSLTPDEAARALLGFTL